MPLPEEGRMRVALCIFLYKHLTNGIHSHSLGILGMGLANVHRLGQNLTKPALNLAKRVCLYSLFSPSGVNKTS